MADFVFFPSPIYYWTIRNYKTSGTILSPTFTFFGFKWRLKFTRFMSADGQKVQIDLESLSGSNEVQNVVMDCEIRVEGGYNLTQAVKVALENRKCCVWSYSTAYIAQKYSALTDLVFSIKLIPWRTENQQFFSEELERQETLEKIPWMTSLLKDFASLYNSKDHSDYELKCKQVSLAVHKAILSARCGYFAALFSSPTKESDKKFVKFQNMEPESLQHVIRYFYTGTLPQMPLDAIHNVYSVADMFLCEPIKMKCVSLMIDDFIKKDETNAGKKETRNITEDVVDSKNLLKQLFLTREWKLLSDVHPNLVHEMCKPILFGTVKI